jgi:hypothetical protein
VRIAFLALSRLAKVALMIVVRRYVVPEADPVMHSLQGSSVAMQLICVDEILEALPRKWCLKKIEQKEIARQ